MIVRFHYQGYPSIITIAYSGKAVYTPDPGGEAALCRSNFSCRVSPPPEDAPGKLCAAIIDGHATSHFTAWSGHDGFHSAGRPINPAPTGVRIETRPAEISPAVDRRAHGAIGPARPSG